MEAEDRDDMAEADRLFSKQRNPSAHAYGDKKFISGWRRHDPRNEHEHPSGRQEIRPGLAGTVTEIESMDTSRREALDLLRQAVARGVG